MTILLTSDVTCSANEDLTYLPVWMMMFTVLLPLIFLLIFVVVKLTALNDMTLRDVWERKHPFKTIDEFISNRGNTSLLWNTLSLVATSFNAYIVTAIPDIAALAGWPALVGGIFAVCLPRIVLAIVGTAVFDCMSGRGFTSLDFLLSRFGIGVYCVSVTLSFSVSVIILTAAYATVLEAFRAISGDAFAPWIVIVSFSVITMLYSLFGGLPGIMITDSIQSILSLLLFLVLFVCTLVTLNEKGMSWSDWQEASKLTGIPSPWSMAFSLVFATLPVDALNQSNWQRLYSAKNLRTATNSVLLSALIMVPVSLMLGIIGFAAASAESLGIVCPVDGNHRFYDVVRLLSNGWKIIVSLFVIFLSTSSVDSVFGSILAIMATPIQKANISINWARLVVVTLNIIAITISSCTFYDPEPLYMAGSLVSATVFPQYLMGLTPITSAFGALTGIIASFTSVVFMGYYFLDKTHGPLRGFYWFVYPSAYGEFTMECMVTFLTTTVVSFFFAFIVSSIQAIFYPMTISDQKALLKKMGSADEVRLSFPTTVSSRSSRNSFSRMSDQNERQEPKHVDVFSVQTSIITAISSSPVDYKKYQARMTHSDGEEEEEEQHEVYRRSVSMAAKKPRHSGRNWSRHPSSST